MTAGTEATAVARPVNKAPERGTVITTPTCNAGGARERVPPASDTLLSLTSARDRSQMAETPRGSVDESPVRPSPHAPKQKTHYDNIGGLWISSLAFVCALPIQQTAPSGLSRPPPCEQTRPCRIFSAANQLSSQCSLIACAIVPLFNGSKRSASRCAQLAQFSNSACVIGISATRSRADST